jgi:hypothetical protein
MWNASAIARCSCIVLFSTLGALAAPRAVWGQGVLESPQALAQSGIGLVSGWKCTAGTLTFSIDGGPSRKIAYGTSRADTQAACGDSDNGFGYLINWSLLGDGPHTIQLFDNGVEFASTTFSVKTLGVNFLQGATAVAQVANFPQPGEDVVLEWRQGAQNFVITERSIQGSSGICATRTGAVTNFLTGNQLVFTIVNPCAGGGLVVNVAAPAGNTGSAFLCSAPLDLVQAGQQFSDDSFSWETAQGGVVCGGLLPGTTTQTTVALNSGVGLDLTKAFAVVYDQVEIADFK